MILTHKTGPLPNSIPTIDLKELYKSQWRLVQNLASEFWRKWKDEYLSTLQIRRKWTSEETSLKEGDIVLLKEADTPRNHWPLVRISKTFPSCDRTVRKVEVCVFKDNTRVHYVRPIHKLVPLVVSYFQSDRCISSHKCYCHDVCTCRCTILHYCKYRVLVNHFII